MNPFTVVIVSSHNYPTSPSIPTRLKKAAHNIGSKMDLANPVMKAFLAGSFSVHVVLFFFNLWTW